MPKKKARKATKNRHKDGYTSSKAQRLRNRARMAQKGLCFWCSFKMYSYDSTPSPLLVCTADRVTPGKHRGRYVSDNIVAAHAFCNQHRSTGDREIPQWEFQRWLVAKMVIKKIPIKVLF